MAQPTRGDLDSPRDFAHAFGDALKQFLEEKGMGQNDAARELGLQERGGARLHSYLHDRADGTRPRPEAEILYLLCAKLDFRFDYTGYRISASSLNGAGRKPVGPAAEQMTFRFDRQFNLSNESGSVGVKVKRPPGRIELTISLDAAAP